MLGTLDLRRLRYFLAIAEHGSISAAARALNIAQPALSYHLAELEKLLDLTLVLRSRMGVRLTPEGETLRRHAADIVYLADAAEQTMARLARRKRPADRVRLAIITSLAAELTPLLVDRMQVAGQRATLSIMEAGTRDIEKRLAEGRIDMALSLAAPPGVDAAPIADEDLLFVAPRGTVLGTVLPEADLARHSYVLPAPGNPLRDFLDDAAHRRGFVTEVVLEVDGSASRFNAVANGIGCTFLGAHSIPAAAQTHGLCVLSVSPPLTRPIYLGQRQGLDAVLARTMRSIIAMALADLGLHTRTPSENEADMI